MAHKQGFKSNIKKNLKTLQLFKILYVPLCRF